MSRNYSTRALMCICWRSPACGWSGMRTLHTITQPCPVCGDKVVATAAEPLERKSPNSRHAPGDDQSETLFPHDRRKGGLHVG
jgi:hypothetical protein